MRPKMWLNGVDLARWVVTSGTTWRPPVSVRASLVEVPGRHGAVSLGLPIFDEPTVTINLTPIVESGTGSLDEMLADLSMVLASPNLTVRREIDGRIEEARARLVTIAPSDDFIDGKWGRVVVTLALPGVFFRDIAHTRIAVPSGNSFQTGPGGSGPIDDAIIRFGPGPFTTKPTLTDITTGTSISIDNTALGGAWYWYISVGEMRAWSQTDSATSGFDNTADNRSDLLDYGTAGILQLWPVAGVISEKVVSRRVHLNSTHPVTIQYRRAWL